MATVRLLCIRGALLPPSSLPLPPLFARFSRSHSTTTDAAPDAASPPPVPHRRYPPPRPHEFSKPCELVGSWTPCANPREAAAKLDRLHRDYRKQMKQVRAEYAYEMELLRIENQRKDDARREAVRLANEERKKAKAAAAETRAAERKAFKEELRLTLLKERTQKLESWRTKEKLREEKKAEKNELLRRQSSEWIKDENFERKILEAIVDTTPL
ncbi:hypothetical protein B296_00006974 [Ensete ventricosum]|uniref:Uncharacterized protein n=1 Tax=Ensete ventricosum TaxID=4639 RepID=A0A427ADN7_ENSVE|nr:hypothetical protein B296_00006974 [Ensete ventricosum]